MGRPLPQVGAPDPQRLTSPIADDAMLDDDSGDRRDAELEQQAACYFNGRSFAAGTYVQSGDEVLMCGRGGLWERCGEREGPAAPMERPPPSID